MNLKMGLGIRALARVLAAILLGMLVPSLYACADLAGHWDDKLYWIDEREAIQTLIVAGAFFGLIVGLVWAIIQYKQKDLNGQSSGPGCR